MTGHNRTAVLDFLRDVLRSDAMTRRARSLMFSGSCCLAVILAAIACLVGVTGLVPALAAIGSILGVRLIGKSRAAEGEPKQM